MNLRTKDIYVSEGWGIDENKDNDPTYPMRNREYTKVPSRPEQQIARVEILQSNERPHYTAVFGETVPPSGISGQLRRYAFQHSESRYRHWLPLLLADRINVVEELVNDIKKGNIPNLFVEMGGRALWKHDKRTLLMKTARYTLCTVAAFWLIGRVFKK
ncbi:hypothetical protein [Sphingobacterium sp. SGL-16]|uniref:hypothetical protein n=1 Tax=Sphingobacterium sp. SGL-16 TaxID=2710883 RepID=UPI0013EC7CBE|nr:hypothetical protein [Sphingobacterium sp. SGL-16]NGM73787.1 hypothetical protein [Sphingobacterium sp. SGL-16]